MRRSSPERIGGVSSFGLRPLGLIRLTRLTRRRSRWSECLKPSSFPGAREKSGNGRITGVDGGLKSGDGVGEALVGS
ncbi:hypothetical protein V6Z11_A01G206000 [Gossypium hirsutum]